MTAKRGSTGIIQSSFLILLLAIALSPLKPRRRQEVEEGGEASQGLVALANLLVFLLKSIGGGETRGSYG